MDQREWLACTQPRMLLDFLWQRSMDWKPRLLGWLGSRHSRLSSRKLRLLSEAAKRAAAAHSDPGAEAAFAELLSRSFVALANKPGGNTGPFSPGDVCPDCSGSGARPRTPVTPDSPCARCNGRGEILRGFFRVTCEACGGRGAVIPYPCPTCRGLGTLAARTLFAGCPTPESGIPQERAILLGLEEWTREMAEELETPRPAWLKTEGELALEAARDRTARTEESKEACGLLREVFGNPFRAITLDPVCRTPVVLALAQTTYENRAPPTGHLDPERLDILVDALKEAGCGNADILAHLRGPGLHVKGCWAVDLVLGKE